MFHITNKIIEKLHNCQKNTFALSELEGLCNADSYAVFVAIVKELEHSGIISPVKKSGTNGCNPPLYMKYRILAVKEETTSFDSELDSMHYWINTEPLRKNPKKYQKHRTYLLCLSEFMKRHSDTLSLPMSENERAYAIWNDEKALDISTNISLLKECGVWERLNTYSTPEPFFDYRRTAVPEHVLVIENKDTWFTMRKLMIEYGTGLFWEIPIDCLVYGEGNKITQKNSSLEQYLNIDRSFHGTVWYWGDLDPEGIGFFLSARMVNPRLHLHPFYRHIRKCCFCLSSVFQNLTGKCSIMCAPVKSIRHRRSNSTLCFRNTLQASFKICLIKVITYHRRSCIISY